MFHSMISLDNVWGKKKMNNGDVLSILSHNINEIT
jgi:hypothetical protein